MSTVSIETIISFAKRRGFVFQSSELYGGFSAAYDFGPPGVLMKNNIKKAWWEWMLKKHENIVGLDSAILMSPKIWEASGHLSAGFADDLVECKKCNSRFRVDQVQTYIEEKEDLELIKKLQKKGIKEESDEVFDSARNLIFWTCEKCGNKNRGSEPRKFNLMMKTFVGPVEDEAAVAYLRPETAQGIYVNFENVMQTQRLKLPFGIAQIGKAFRNEITPKDFLYRTREFEQMEMQWFCSPGDAEKFFEYWLRERLAWYEDLGIKKENIRITEVPKEELAHYAKRAVDIEYNFPFGWKEIEGIHNRGDWDLSNHSKYSGKELKYTDSESGEQYYPHIVETSIGVDRFLLALLCDAYEIVEGGRTTTTEAVKEEEVVLRLHPSIAPLQIAVFPLVRNKEEIIQSAKSISQELKRYWFVQYDEAGSIGRRYRRQDEIGTPFCVTVDYQTVEDNTVTVRDRDTMTQERIATKDAINFFKEKFEK